MACFRCGECGADGSFEYAGLHRCLECGSQNVRFALSLIVLPEGLPTSVQGKSLRETLSELTAVTQTQRLWIMSDLHLELTRGWDLPAASARPAFDVLVVAGDLVTGMERGVRWLRERVTDRPVLYVAGNHEPYGRDIARDLEKARVAAAGTNVHVLENESLTVDGTTFLGATMWTDFALRGDPEAGMRLAGEKMNDYRKIRTGNYRLKLRPLDTLRKHQESRAFITRELAAHRGERCVVVTHHSPLPHPDGDPLSVAFTSDLTSLILDGAPCLWVFGHTHESVDTTVGSTRVVSNAKGYGPWSRGERCENPHFDPNFTVEI